MLNQKTSQPQLICLINWKIALCILFLVAVLIRLGFWQLGRAEQKRLMQNNFNTRQTKPPIAIESLSLDKLNSLKHTKVILYGHYINKQTMLISNQIFQGRPGYEVVTAFKLLSSNQIVLVSRGWISVDYKSGKLPAVEQVSGLQQLSGEIHVPLKQSFFLPHKLEQPVTWPIKLHHFNINDISKLFNRPVLSIVVRLDTNNPGLLKRHWRQPRIQPENSISYAIQWFAMALILLMISIAKSTNIVEIIHSQLNSRKSGTEN